MELFQAIVFGLVPSIGVGFLFYVIMKSILRGDRSERLAYSQWLAQQEEAESAKK